MLLGETNVDTLENLATYYGSGDDELHMGFNFPFIEAPFEAEALAGIVARTESLLPAPAWPVWTGSNHDVSRLATRWCEGDPAKVRLALLMLLTLRGTPVLYQGDEIGLTDREFDKDELLDPVGLRFWPYYPGRDPERTPMQWDGGPNAGFTAAGVTPWLPHGRRARERGRPARRARLGAALRARRHRPAAPRRPTCSAATTAPVPVADGLWVWRRGGTRGGAQPLGHDAAWIVVDATADTTVALSTHRAREGPVGGRDAVARRLGGRRRHQSSLSTSRMAASKAASSDAARAPSTISASVPTGTRHGVPGDSMASAMAVATTSGPGAAVPRPSCGRELGHDRRRARRRVARRRRSRDATPRCWS